MVHVANLTPTGSGSDNPTEVAGEFHRDGRPVIADDDALRVGGLLDPAVEEVRGDGRDDRVTVVALVELFEVKFGRKKKKGCRNPVVRKK